MDSNDLLLARPAACWPRCRSAPSSILLVNPYFSGERRTDKRIQGVTESKAARIAVKAQADAAQNRRRQVADTLKELEDRQKAREKVSLRLRLQRAGLDITPRSFWIASVACGRARRRSASGCRRRTCRSSCRCSAAFVGALGPAALDPRAPHQAPADQVHRRVRQRHRRHRARRQVGPAADRVPWHHRARVRRSRSPASSPSSSSSSASACRWARPSSA